MLARNYRFGIYNDTGVTIAAEAATVKARRWKGSSDGTREDESSETEVYKNSGQVTDGSYDTGSGIDNSSDEYEGGDFELEVTTTGSPSGDVVVYYEASTDAGTSWPSGRTEAVPVCVLNFAASGTKRKAFRL